MQCLTSQYIVPQVKHAANHKRTTNTSTEIEARVMATLETVTETQKSVLHVASKATLNLAEHFIFILN